MTDQEQAPDDLATDARAVNITINGTCSQHYVQPRTHLVDFLREGLGLKGSHLGCEHGVCGACTVQLDGQVVRGCLVLAVQADGRTVTTIEGLSDSGAIRELQQDFVRLGTGCGYQTAVLAPLVIARKGVYTELADWARPRGYTHLRVDGEFLPTPSQPQLID